MTTEKPRSDAGPRAVSGTVFAVCFVVVAAATVLSVLLLSPRLQDDVAARLGGLIDRSVLVSGSFNDETWAVAAAITNDDTCLLVESDRRTAGQVCDSGGEALLRDVGVTRLERDARWFFTGISAPDVQVVRLELSEGDPLILRVQRPRGYTSGFYVTVLDPHLRVESVTAVAVTDEDLGTLSCQPAVATVEGVGGDCRVSE
ncbi:MAG: hypothetical protein GEU81_01730 [Nitriliruptorales bacterium]|nr:hypothetical protein [Nitriliruptorales bacterium]